MSWAIICGRTETGFSIFRPTDGLDEGPVILTRAVRIEPEDTLGSLYFGKIFPMGVAGLVEVAELVVAGKAPALVQYEPDAGYEGILRDAESRINWANHVDIIYNLIRGCDPAPGAWTTMDGKKLFVFNAAKRIARTFSEVKGKKLGEAVAIGGKLVVHGQGGFIEIERVRPDGGRKIADVYARLPSAVPQPPLDDAPQAGPGGEVQEDDRVSGFEADRQTGGVVAVDDPPPRTTRSR